MPPEAHCCLARAGGLLFGGSAHALGDLCQRLDTVVHRWGTGLKACQLITVITPIRTRERHLVTHVARSVQQNPLSVRDAGLAGS